MSIKVIKWGVAAIHSKSFQLLLMSIKMIKWGCSSRNVLQNTRVRYQSTVSLPTRSPLFSCSLGCGFDLIIAILLKYRDTK